MTFLSKALFMCLVVLAFMFILVPIEARADLTPKTQGITDSKSKYQEQSDDNTLYYDLGLESGWVPYQRAAEPGKPGVYAELMESIEKRSDITIRPVYLPPKRAAKALQIGLVDFDFNVLEWMEDGMPGEGFVLSEPLYTVTEYLITTNQHASMFNQKSDYYGHSIGTIAGYFYFDADRFTRVDFLSEEALLVGLAKGRFKAIIMEEHAAKYWADKHKVDIVLAVQHTKGPVRMRLREEKAQLLPALNRAITSLKSDGTIKHILANHGIEQER